MAKLPRVSGDDVKKALEKAGFELAGQKGSHVKLKHSDGRIVIVPMHRELKKGTLKSILRQAKLSVDQFIELLKH
jgi:predicted RNA binding protein YcfA (HicA-like mRNA interferase family)